MDKHFSEHLNLIFRDLKPVVHKLTTVIQIIESAKSCHSFWVQNVELINLLQGQQVHENGVHVPEDFEGS